MGIAAYNRGSRVVSESIFGADVRVPARPKPRPESRGAKTLARASARAASLRSYFAKKNVDVSEGDLADMLVREIGCGRATAEAAVKASKEAE